MGVYSRYKRSPEGLRQLVELFEATPLSRRQKMIDVGMAEDPEFTKRALDLVLTFDDIINLPDLELAELLAETPAQFVGFAIHKYDKAIHERIVSKCQPRSAADIKEILENPNITATQVGGGKMKMIEVARKLEKKGLMKTKRIPMA